MLFLYLESELLAYWIHDYAVYHDEERTFDISKSGVFQRGEVIKVNLGFNIGNELGGMHYCVVLSKYDNTRNGALNVIPLTSKKANKRYDYSCVNLGDELYYDDVFKKVRISNNSLDLINKQIIKSFTK